MNEQVILEAIVGSTLHGTAVQDGLEDLDLTAVVLESSRQFVGFNVEDTWVSRTKPEGVRSEAGDIDRATYGLRKFLKLALKGNPSILLTLFAPFTHIRSITNVGRELLELAPHIVSAQAYSPFRGYMRQQYERLLNLRGQRNVTRPELVEKFGYDTKYAAHIVRLGLQGEELMLHGRITLPMPYTQRELVLAIREGKLTLKQSCEAIEQVEKWLETAANVTRLPDKPNQKLVESWMIKTYLNHWSHHETRPD